MPTKCFFASKLRARRCRFSDKKRVSRHAKHSIRQKYSTALIILNFIGEVSTKEEFISIGVERNCFEGEMGLIGGKYFTLINLSSKYLFGWFKGRNLLLVQGYRER